MAKKQKKLVKKLLAISLAAAMVAGGVPASVGVGLIGTTGIVANAVDYTELTVGNYYNFNDHFKGCLAGKYIDGLAQGSDGKLYNSVTDAWFQPLGTLSYSGGKYATVEIFYKTSYVGGYQLALESVTGNDLGSGDLCLKLVSGDGSQASPYKFKVARAYVQSGDYWGLTADGTLELFGQLPDSIPTINNSPFYSRRNDIKKIVALSGAKAGTSLQYVFYGLDSVTSIDLSKLDTSNVTNMEGLFENCSNVETIDVSTWDTSNVTTMKELFQSCSKLKSIDVSRWNTSSVTNMNYLFNSCRELETLNVSAWNTSNVTKFTQVFSVMDSLKTLDIGSWDFGKANLSDNSIYGMFVFDKALESIRLPGLISTSSFIAYNFSFYKHDSLKQITFTSAYDLTTRAFIPNEATDRFAQGWFNEDGEMVSGTGEYAVVKGEAGTIRRVKSNLSTATITVDDQIYTGEAIEPTATVTDGTKTLVKDTDYTVEYADNTDIGTATVTVTGTGDCVGEQEVEFDIAASLTVPEDVTVSVYKDKTNLADKIDGKDAVKEGYYIVSDKQLTFNDEKIDAREYKPGASNHPFKSNDELKAKYCYYVLGLSDNVVATHSHTYKVQTADDKLNVRCEGEPGGYKTAAELTIAEGNYEYGDRVDIEGKTYAVEEYDVKDTDVTFGNIYFKNTANDSTSTTSMPTELGTYSAEIGAIFDGTRYSLYKEFEIGKKDISKLVKESDPTADKNDHIEVSLKPAEGAVVPGYTVTYNGKQYTPVIKLVNYVYDYNNKQYKESVLVEGTDYTAVLTPQTNAGHYTVTINAKENSVNYKGTGTFDWDITKRNFENLSVNDTRTAEQKVYDGQAVQGSEFTVEGLGNDTNPGTESGNTFTYKWYKLNPSSIIEEDDINLIPADAFTEIGSAPKDAGIYRVDITVKNNNYNDTAVAKNFEIKQRTITITPSAENNITYGETVGNLAWTASNEVEGEAVQARDVDLKVIKAEVENSDPTYVKNVEILNAGEYKYALGHEDVPSNANYKLALADNAKLTVNKKALTKDMFKVSPTKLTYNGSQQTVNVTASDKVELETDPYELVLEPLSIERIKNTDWEIVDNSNKGTNAGNYTVKVKATENGNYSGELTLDNNDQKWTIEGKDINSGSDDPENSMSVEALDKTYTGENITETVTVKDGTKTLTIGTDYEIITEPDGDKYTDAQSLTQKNAGTYTFYIKGKGNYSGEKKATWKINPAEIESVKLTGGTKTYDGKPVADKDFRVTIKGLKDGDNAKDLTKTFVFKSDDISVDAPTNAGTYTAELTVSDPKGNYKAKTVTAAFEIKPREVEVYPAEGQTFEYGADITVIEDAINNIANIELEQAEEDSATGIIAADNNADTLTLMFGDKPFTIADAGDGIINVGYYDIVTKEDMDVIGNYKLVYEYPVQVEVTKATLKDEWFTLYIRDEDTNEDSAVETSEVTFTGKKIIVKANNGQALVEGTDYTVNGDKEVYLPGEYTIDIKGKGNYTGTVKKTYKVEPNKEIHAKTVAPESSYNPETSSYEYEYTYDGNSPEVSVTEVPGSAPLPELSKVTYKYWQKVGQDWVEMIDAPVNAGDYKVQGEVTAKGYEIEVDAAEFTIARKKINITVDSKDLKGVYGQETFTVPYTYADDAIIDKDKGTVTITGDIVVNVANGGAGEYELDYSGVTINSNNYELVFPNGLKFNLSKKELEDSNIVFDSENVVLHDIGTSTASFRVVVDGKTLVKDVDYTVAGTTEADEAGTYKVQVLGKGNYVGFAEASWTLADDADARAAAQAEIAQNVTVALGDNVSAKLSGGKKRVTATVNASAGEGYTITKTGFVYIPAADYVEGQLVIGGEGVTNAGRNNAASYTYGMIDNTGTGIYARGYAVVNNGAYETVVYTDAQELVYDDLVRYTVTVEGGTIVSTYPQEGYSGTQVKNDKPTVRVSLDQEQTPEGQKFLRWEKDGVVISYNEVFSFAVSEKDSTIKAVYVDEDEVVEKQVATYVESVTPNKDTKKITFVSAASIPDELTMVKTGIVATNDAAIGEDIDVNSTVITDGCSVFVKELAGVTENTKNAKYTWTKAKVVEGQTWYVRSYVEYIDANNEHQILYGEIVKANLDGIIA